jgi:hypothetical protein
MRVFVVNLKIVPLLVENLDGCGIPVETARKGRPQRDRHDHHREVHVFLDELVVGRNNQVGNKMMIYKVYKCITIKFCHVANFSGHLSISYVTNAMGNTRATDWHRDIFRFVDVTGQKNEPSAGRHARFVRAHATMTRASTPADTTDAMMDDIERIFIDIQAGDMKSRAMTLTAWTCVPNDARHVDKCFFAGDIP